MYYETIVGDNELVLEENKISYQKLQAGNPKMHE